MSLLLLFALGAFHVAHAQAGRGSGGSPIGNIRFGGTDNSPRASSMRTVQGQVTGTDGKPVAGAIVYVKNTHTSNILSIEADAQGAYRFGSLSPAYDYEVWAKDGDKKTPVKIASSFIETTVLNIPLAFDSATPTPPATAAKPTPAPAAVTQTQTPKA
jgi:hypothetical protein